MVTTTVDRDAAVEKVIKLLSSLPAGGTDIRLEEDRYEYRIDVRPKAKNHCNFWLGFSAYGTYGLCFGHGLAFEELSIQEFPPHEVARAILDGRVHEAVWFAGGKAIKSKGEIILHDGRRLQDKAVLTILGVFGLGRRKEMAYAPFSNAEL